MRIFLVTFDTNLINTKQQIQAMNTLEYWNDLGLIHLVRTDTMEIEFEKSVGKGPAFIAKASKFKEDYGINLIRHSKYNRHIGGLFVKPSIIDEISSILFEKLISGNKFIEERRIRDVVHLNTHYMNDRDFFISYDRNFHDKKHILKQKFNINVLKPEECVDIIEEYWRNDRSDGLPIKNPNYEKASIMIGNEVSHHLVIKNPDKVFLKIQNWKNKYFVVSASLYNRKGYPAVELNPEEAKVKVPGCRVGVSYFHENDIGILMPIEKKLYSELYIHDSDELLLKGEIFKNGNLLLYCRVYNQYGRLLANISKDTLQYDTGCLSSFYEEKHEDGTVNMHLIDWGECKI